MPNIFDFDRILKTECNLQHFTRNCRIKNLDDFERDETDAYLWRTGLLNVTKKGMTICYIMNRCLVMFLRGGFLCSIDKRSPQNQRWTSDRSPDGSATENQKY